MPAVLLLLAPIVIVSKRLITSFRKWGFVREDHPEHVKSYLDGPTRLDRGAHDCLGVGRDDHEPQKGGLPNEHF